MKKVLKIFFLISGVLLIITLGMFLTFYISASNVKLNEKKFVNPERSAIFYDINGDVISELEGGVKITEIEKIPEHTKNAFIAIEDKRFYSHNGVDFRGLMRAAINNVKSASFKEGGSTITQQLIKNTHLSNEKTLKRKIAEIKLAIQLEKKYSKDEILEKYLNTIYFGDSCYGITAATQHYFNKLPEELTINESAVLAGIVKAPSYYSPFANADKCNERKNLVLKEMYNQNYITKEDFEYFYATPIETCKNNTKKEFDYLYLARQELSEIIEESPYGSENLNIYTNNDIKFQQILKDTVQQFNNCDQELSAILLSTTGNVLAYYSTCGDVNRQMGSTLKPLAVYAPAIQYDVVNSYTLLEDVKTDFNGYSPSNYNDKYYGKISVKDSIAVSSNVCAAKLLNYVGLNKSTSILNRVGIPLADSDNSLALALGATEKGAKLSQITGAYTVFANGGRYNKTSCINTLKSKNEVTLYKNIKNNSQVIGEDTAFIVSDMLKNVVDNGTAKKLSYTNLNLYAKTGTVGTENGNSDAYVISYSSEYVLGMWFGATDKNLLDNSVTGGGLPCQLAAEIWKNIYAENNAPAKIEKPQSVVSTYIDKLSYDEDGEVILYDANAPERFKSEAIFKSSSLPKTSSTRFTNPELKNYKTTVNHNNIDIELCLTKPCDALVYKLVNGKRELLFDTKKDGTSYTDRNLLYNYAYTYVIVPYFTSNYKTFYGTEITLDKIKTPNGEFGDDWWNNDFD